VEHELGGRSGPLNSRIYCYLRDFDPAASLFWSAATGRWRVRRRILLYLTKLHKMTPGIRGKDLLDLGYSPTPRIGVILDKLKLLCLDGELAGREDEIDFVTNQFPK